MIKQTFTFALAAISVLLPSGAAVAQEAPSGGGFVYVMTNKTDNSVLVYQRNPDGSLNQVDEVSTGGQGTGTGGDPLGSEGSLTLDGAGRFLLAVNAASNEVSSLMVTQTGLQFAGKSPSGGTMPISLAVDRDIAYVLNAGATPNVTALRLGLQGQLTMIAGSTQPLAGGPGSGPAQVGVTPDGRVLVVTEKNTNQIDLFSIENNGNLTGPFTAASNGATPFGFAFGRDNSLIVSEAANATFSSYRIMEGTLTVALQTVTASLPDGGKAACWTVTERAGRLAFAANAGSSTISSLSVGSDGSLALLAAEAANTGQGSTPIDLALTPNGAYLYNISTSNGALSGFRVQNGMLTPVAAITGLPLSIQGIAAR